MIRGIASVVVCFTILTGCTGINIKAQDGMVVRTVGETNLLRPSLSVMEVVKCVPGDARHYEEIVVNDEKVGCHGQFVTIATVQGTQAGALTGLGSAAIQGGAIVGGAYLIGDGIRDSADNTSVSQVGGGARSTSTSRSNARSTSQSKSYNRNNNSNVSNSVSNGNGNNGRGGMD